MDGGDVEAGKQTAGTGCVGEPMATGHDPHHVGIHPAERLFFSLVNFPGKIIVAVGAELRAGTAVFAKSAATEIVLTASGKRIHVVERPDQGGRQSGLGQKSAVIDEVGDPVEVNDVAVRHLLEKVLAKDGSVVAEMLESGGASGLVGSLSAAQEFATGEAHDSFPERVGRLILVNFFIFALSGGDEHLGILALAPEGLVEAMSGAGGPAGKIRRADMYDAPRTSRIGSGGRFPKGPMKGFDARGGSADGRSGRLEGGG